MLSVMASETSNHQRYEEFCALAALGEIAAEEFAELNHHIRVCATCRTSYARFTQILQAQFLPVDSRQTWRTKLADFFLRGDKHKKRFLARAKELGLRVPEETETRQSFWSRLWGLSLPRETYRYSVAFIIIALLLMVGMQGHWWRESLAENAARSAEFTGHLGKLGDQNNRLREQEAKSRERESSLVTQLTTARRNISAFAARHNVLQAELQQALVALQSLKAELGDSRETADNKLREAEQTLHAMMTKLENLQQARSQDASFIATQQVELEDLSRRLREQTRMLGRERRLMVADRDIRELMGARNLHVYDVTDFEEGNGKDTRSFGRLFYTEGKSLIFYAFDLSEPDVNTAKHSFQVWGQRKDRRGSVVSLGIFYIDNAEQRRWILKFEDPAVLSQINAVFVTVEPFGGRKRPTGEKLLYAYLSNKPNHP